MNDEPPVVTTVGNRMAKRAEQIRQDHNMIVSQDTHILNCPMSFDPLTPEGKAKIINSLGQGDYEITFDKPAVLDVTDYLVMPGEFVDKETGEVEFGTWLVLFDKDGKMLKSTSSVLPKRVKTMLEIYDKEDWKDGVRIMVCERISPTTKRKYHDIKIIPKAAQNPAQ